MQRTQLGASLFKRHAVGQETPLGLLPGLTGVHLRRKRTQGSDLNEKQAGGRSGPAFHTPGEVAAPHPGGRPRRVLTLENRVLSEKSRWLKYSLLECPDETATIGASRASRKPPCKGLAWGSVPGKLCPGSRLTGQAPTDWPCGDRPQKPHFWS